MKSFYKWFFVRARLSQFAEKVDVGQVLVAQAALSRRAVARRRRVIEQNL
jgi:hypothetical protein